MSTARLGIPMLHACAQTLPLTFPLLFSAHPYVHSVVKHIAFTPPGCAATLEEINNFFRISYRPDATHPPINIFHHFRHTLFRPPSDFLIIRPTPPLPCRSSATCPLATSTSSPRRQIQQQPPHRWQEHPPVLRGTTFSPLHGSQKSLRHVRLPTISRALLQQMGVKKNLRQTLCICSRPRKLAVMACMRTQCLYR